MNRIRQLAEQGRWEARRLARRLGAVGLAGVMLIITAFSLDVYVWSMSVRQAEIVKQYAQVRQEKLPIPLDSDDPEKKLGNFYAYLLPHNGIPDQVKSLITLSQEENVVLLKGEYKAQSEVDAGFLRFRIVLPVKGDYSAIQSFLLRALQENKTLALESVAFKRKRIEEREVEARIEFVLFTREQKIASGTLQ